MIVREERMLLHRLLSAFARGEMLPQDLVHRLRNFPAAKDEAVDDLVFEFAMRHEDEEMEAVCVSREEWNLLQRALLFLESELPLASPEFRGGRVWVWIWANHAAFAAVAFCGIALCAGGWYWNPLFAVVALAACGCRWLHARMNPEMPEPGIPFEQTYPFSNFPELLAERKRNTVFRKTAYPQAIAARWERAVSFSWMANVVGILLLVFLCVVIWPAVLLALCVPDSAVRERGGGEQTK